MNVFCLCRKAEQQCVSLPFSDRECVACYGAEEGTVKILPEGGLSAGKKNMKEGKVKMKRWTARDMKVRLLLFIHTHF